MGPDAGKHARNILILFALAAILWLVPGGGTAAATIGNVLGVILFAGLAFFAYRLYMEHRITLLDLPDRTRLILYGSFALIVFALLAMRRLWDQGGAGALLWLALVGGAIYGVYSVWRASREY
ncbi:MAG TPA: hypothetical protein VF533_04875 [Solirubrobacteraceae bacterium]